MHRPLETPFWMRFKQFLKGVFLYNTIYWRRASDDLDIQRMSREERASLRPKRDLEIIRPRENPRPVVAQPAPSDPAPPAAVSAPPRPAAKAPTPVMEEEGVVEIQRRKKRRRSRHSSVIPKRYYDPSAGSGGIFGWLKKK